MKKISSEFRLAGGLLFGLILLLSAGWQLYRVLQEYRSNSLWVTHTYQVLDQLNEVKADVLELESIQRLYFITGDDVFTNQRDTRFKQARQAAKNVELLTADNPRQQLLHRGLTQKLEERLGALEKTLHVYQTEGFDATRKHLINGAPRIIMENLLEQINSMEQEERVLLEQRKIQIESNFVQARGMGILVLIITLGGGVLLWQQFRRDLMQRVEAETAVRESESMLKQVLDILPVGVVICDRDGLLTQINPCSKEIWGGSRRVSPHQYGEYAGWWPDTGKRIAAEEWAMARTMKTGETILNELADIRCFDGSRKTISNSTAPLRDESGRLIGGLSVNVDVTEFTRTERKDGHAVPGGHYEHYLEIMVSDSGIGIPEDVQSQLFKPFTQIDNSLSRRYQGTGLGLAMVKRMAELHDGSVAVSSIAGKGSTFTVLLPWRTANLPGRQFDSAPVTSHAAQGHDKAIRDLLALIVEDDDQASEVLRVQLESVGFRAMRAKSAEVALKIAEQEHPDLITLDILLPGMDGWEFLERFKQQPLFASTPVVIISIVADLGRGLSLGAAHVMQKPIAREELTTALTVLGFCRDTEAKHKTALVVDDDPKAVKLVCTQLESFGYKTLSALGGQEGIDSARQHEPDLIILDLMMPEINGFDVVEALKSDTVTASIPIIVLTAKQVTVEDRLRLSSDVKKVMEKSEFNHGRFLGEVKRAMMGRGK